MRTSNGTIEGDIIITDEFTVSGMINGNITVGLGGTFILYGMCLQTVTIQKGGTAKLYGMVQKDVINEAGKLELHGTVHGAVKTINGETVISPTAVVTQGITQATGENSQAVGMIGGAALGAAIGGPIGAIVGGVLGAILGKESKGLG
jgi:cytoskeletal protein CcmA (bactofilin family)